MADITLEPRHVEYADRMAARRNDAAFALDRRPHNGVSSDFAAALKLNVLGMRGECAAYLFLRPVKWNVMSASLSRLADFEDWIDAKTIADASHRLIVQHDDEDDWAFLLIVADHPIYRLIGWAWGFECKRKHYWCDPTGCGRAAYFVPNNDPILKSPDRLREHLRKRQCGHG